MRSAVFDSTRSIRPSVNSLETEDPQSSGPQKGLETRAHVSADQYTDQSLSGMGGNRSATSFTESMTAEMRQPLSAQVSRAVLEHIQRQGAQDSESLTLRLDPPELGEMVIELSKTRDGLAIRVSAREAVTMEMLFARGHEIESHLRGREVDLKSLEFLPSGSLNGQTSSDQNRRDAWPQTDSAATSIRRTSRREAVTGPVAAKASQLAPESPHALNFRA
jgi:hypothetical protein